MSFIDGGHIAMAANLADANRSAARWRRRAEEAEARLEEAEAEIARLSGLVGEWTKIAEDFEEGGDRLEKRLNDLQKKFQELLECNDHNYREAEKWAARASELESILNERGNNAGLES